MTTQTEHDEDWESLTAGYSTDGEEEIDAILAEELDHQPKPHTYATKKKFAQGRLALYRLC